MKTLLVLSALLSLSILGVQAAAEVHLVRAPTNALVPDVVFDKAGTLHMVYGAETNAFYLRSTDSGRTFSTALRINSAGSVETRMGERGPKLALTPDGKIHVVWMDYWAPGVKEFWLHVATPESEENEI